MIEELDFITEHPKADMSKVNIIRVNDKEYVSIDYALKIIEKETDYIDSKYVYEGSITYQEYARHFTSIRRAILALKGGDQK